MVTDCSELWLRAMEGAQNLNRVQVKQELCRGPSFASSRLMWRCACCGSEVRRQSRHKTNLHVQPSVQRTELNSKRVEVGDTQFHPHLNRTAQLNIDSARCMITIGYWSG